MTGPTAPPPEPAGSGQPGSGQPGNDQAGSGQAGNGPAVSSAAGRAAAALRGGWTWLRPRVAALPGGVAVWLSSTALAVSVIALLVAIAAGGGTGPLPGARGAVGPTVPVDSGGDEAEPVGTLPADEPVGASGAPGSPASGSPASAASPPDSAADPVQCPAATVTVSDAASLSQALADAKPGTSIRMNDGTYSDKFVASTPGTAGQPIVLCGGPGAVIDAGNVKGGYALHLNGASHWRVMGFTVRNGQKGVMADRVQRVVIQNLTVEQVGDEAIHLRNFSSDNIVRDNVVRGTGLRRDKFGEGIYIGTAESNWCTITACKPDNSDRNVIQGNRISETTAESIDIKEGTTGGTVVGNTFHGGKLSGSHADSWVDVKGNGWTIKNNVGRQALQDGFQTHEVADGWGRDNVFTGNTAEVNGPGWGFYFAPVENNRASCDNKVTGAAKGFANVDCG